MASSKTLLLVALLFTATVLLVVAREIPETTSNTVDTSSGKSEGEVNDVKYPGGGGNGSYAAAAGRKDHCAGYGCCGRKANHTICMCCTSADQKPDADHAAVTVSP